MPLRVGRKKLLAILLALALAIAGALYFMTGRAPERRPLGGKKGQEPLLLRKSA